MLFMSNSYALPNGKPFVEVDGRLIEVEGAVISLQDQVKTLIGDVSSLEESLAAHKTVLSQLLTDFDDLQNQVSTTDADLQDQITNIEGLIGVVQDSIDELKNQLALKQNIINGTCPEGQAVVEITPEGGLVCQLSGGDAGLFNTITLTSTVTFYSRVYSYYVDLRCPGTHPMVIGGGYEAPSQVRILSSGPIYINRRSAFYLYPGWEIRYQNPSRYSSYYGQLYVICLGPNLSTD